MKDLSLIIKKLWPMLKFFSKVGQRSRSRSHVQNLWYHWKGLVIRITHAKYERPISKGKKVMANVKVFWQTDRWTDRTDGPTDRVITIGHPPSGGALITLFCHLCWPAPAFQRSCYDQGQPTGFLPCVHWWCVRIPLCTIHQDVLMKPF